MFSQSQIGRYAEILLWGLQTARRQRFHKNDLILIRFDFPARPLAEALYARLIDMRMHPVVRVNTTPAMEESFYQLSDRKQLVFTPPGDELFYRNLNGSIFLNAPESLTHLKGVDPGKIAAAVSAQKNLRDILTRREADGLLSWTLCVFPTPELARQAGLSLQAYEDQVVRACFLNRRQPVQMWQEVFHQAASIKRRLSRMKVARYHVESENIDLEVAAGERRKWLGISGRNIPSFELFTSPDWRGTRGVFFADQPSFRSGNIVQGVRLEFRSGRVVSVSARKGEGFVRSQLKIDGGADKLGEFSLTDRRFSRINRFMASTLYDENYGGKFGNCHVALGASYTTAFRGRPGELGRKQRQSLGFNDSALHWDLVNTEKKRVSAIGPGGRKRTIYENGEFLL